MKIRILALALAATIVSGCSRGELVATRNTPMTVVAADSNNRRFWVSLIDDRGMRHEHVRLGGKRCRRGPYSLPAGTALLVRVDTYQDEKSGKRTAYLDRDDLRRRFC